MTIAWHNWYVFSFDTWYDDNVMHMTWYVDEWNPLGLCCRSARSLLPRSQRSHTFKYHIFSWSSMMISTQIFFIIFLCIVMQHMSIFLRSSSSFLRIMMQNMHIFLSLWKLWFRKYVAPLFQEVSRAHPIERALLIYLVHEGGGPDEEDLILLALRIGANLGWSSLSKSGMWSCTDQRFFARKVYIQSGRANSTESGIRALEGLVSWMYHRQSVLSGAQGEVPTYSPAETSGQEKNCTCWKLEVNARARKHKWKANAAFVRGGHS